MAPTTPPSPGWLSYDSVAAAYEAVAVPKFVPLARDLVAALAPSPHELVLDVGTGTGLIARTITSAEPLARVVGVDPSRAMLAVAHATAGHIAAIAALAPGLPFRDGSFDAAVAQPGHLPLRRPPPRADGPRPGVARRRPGRVQRLGGPRSGGAGQPAPRGRADREPAASRPRHGCHSARPGRAVGGVVPRSRPASPGPQRRRAGRHHDPAPRVPRRPLRPAVPRGVGKP